MTKVSQYGLGTAVEQTLRSWGKHFNITHITWIHSAHNTTRLSYNTYTEGATPRTIKLLIMLTIRSLGMVRCGGCRCQAVLAVLTGEGPPAAISRASKGLFFTDHGTQPPSTARGLDVDGFGSGTASVVGAGLDILVLMA